MAKLYTRGGDRGMTGIRGGDRVPKDDPRIEANGTLDELNCELGMARALLPAGHEWQAWLMEWQREMMAVMSHVATPSARRAANPTPLRDGMDAECERRIDLLEAGDPDAGWFVLPGGTPLSAQLHRARAVARRAERRLWTLHRTDPLPEAVLRFVNRLSDLLFAMARAEVRRQGWDEERWRSFSCKRENAKNER